MGSDRNQVCLHLGSIILEAPLASDEANEWIHIKIKRPEGYEDVAAELVLEDFVQNPRASWEVELVTTENEIKKISKG